MLYTNKEQLPPSPPSLRDSLTHISYADRKHRQGGVPSSTSSKTPRSELANKVKRKICFALVNRNVYFAAAVDSFFHLHGARRGAPQAIQVADRFHLLLNLTTALQKLFERKQDSLQSLAAEEQAMRLTAPTHEAAAVPRPPPPVPPPLPAAEAQRQGRRARRKRRYDEVIALQQQGASQVAIAALVGLHRDTVRRYITAPSFPEIVRPGKRSKLDPHEAYLQERWTAGQRNIKQLVAELRERGYRHGETIVYDYLRSLRQQPAWLEEYTATKMRPSHGALTLSLSAREAAWLFVCNPQKLRLAQVLKLDPLPRSEERLETAYQLAQDFRVMVTKHQKDALPGWLQEAKGSGIAELQSLAAGIVRDFDAVRAALTLPYSNGQTEGQVNKLKSLKRQMYGRANFDLLRRRGVHAAQQYRS